MSRRRKVFVGALLAALVVPLAFYTLSGIGHETIQLHLKLYGSSIYEYHGRTGNWPTKAEDLATTSLAQQSPYWRVALEQGTDVITWYQKLKPDPMDNAGVILAYHNRGLLASMGRQWVCWGDLRIEYLKADDLGKQLRAQQE